MTPILFFTAILIITVLFGLIWKLRKYLRKRQIAKIYRQPFKAEWVEILQCKVKLYPLLPEELKQALHGHINYFLNEKNILGRNGQVITDEVRLTIAGNACLLVLKNTPPIFPGFKNILVYPDAYVTEITSYDGPIESRSKSVRAGESWHNGPIVLSWKHTEHGSLNQHDGHNVVLHEFAHKLDEENYLMDGLPILRERDHYAEWSQVLNKEFSQLQKRVDRHKNTVIDEYGATSAVEFFAVITESFFEKPVQMQQKLPELYQQLSQYYLLDPAQWDKEYS